jgi:hypothetical protein
MARSVGIAGAISPHVKARSIRRALAHGHLDMELFAKANLLVKVPRWSELYRRTEYVYEPSGQSQSWVLDLDHLGPIDTIEDLRATMAARDTPLPTIIVQTGPCSFHCFYKGKDSNSWPEDKRWWVVEKFSGWNDKSPETREIAAMAVGVDLGYFNHPWFDHQFRVPGSLNSKYVIDGKMWVCRGWKNADWYDPHGQYLRERGKDNLIVPVSDSVVAGQFPTEKSVGWTFIVPITEVLTELYPSGLESVRIDKLAEMLAKSSGWLARNKCHIHQVTWATELGVAQVTVSRLLARLIRQGLLTKVDDTYERGARSKMYGAGDLLRPAIGYAGCPLEEPDWVRWDDGTSFERMLYDVRYFVSLGLSDPDIIERLQEREAHRPTSKQRGVRQFIRTIYKCREYTQKHADDPRVARKDVLDGEAS